MACAGDHVPALPDGVGLTPTGLEPRIQAASRTRLQLTRTTTLWSPIPGTLTRVIGQGAHAPGTSDGVTFNSFAPPVLNNADHIAFWSNSLVGEGINSTNNSGIWAGPVDGLALVAQEGDQAPG